MPAKNPKRCNNKNVPIEMRRVSQLRPHPRQREFFGEPHPDAVTSLARSIAADGLMHALQVLPDGTVIAGHTRLAAVKQLGWKEVPCVVLDELAAENEQAILRYLIRDNVERRQLTRLQQARLTLAVEGYTAKWIRKHGLSEDQRKHLATLFQMTPRNVSRWVRALGAPVRIQDAVDRGELTLAQAGQIGYLPREQQDSIVAAILAGVAPAEAIAEFVEARRTSGSANAAFRRYVKATRAAVFELGGKLDDLGAYEIGQHRRILEQAVAMLRDLLRRGSSAEVAREEESFAKAMQDGD